MVAEAAACSLALRSPCPPLGPRLRPQGLRRRPFSACSRESGFRQFALEFVDRLRSSSGPLPFHFLEMPAAPISRPPRSKLGPVVVRVVEVEQLPDLLGRLNPNRFGGRAGNERQTGGNGRRRVNSRF